MAAAPPITAADLVSFLECPHPYTPSDVKRSVRARGTQIVQVVSYALLVEPVQGVRPREGFTSYATRRRG